MKSIQRILAILGAAALFGLVILTMVLAVTGSPYFMASFYAIIVIPVFIYGYLIILRILSAKQKDRIKDILEEGGREDDTDNEEKI